MPIYAYRCATCGHAKDVLRKMSDPPLVECPFCGAPTFVKQVTAAGFQLKGSGWYVTDFKGGAAAPQADSADGGGTAKPDAKTASDTGAGDSKSDAASASKGDAASASAAKADTTAAPTPSASPSPSPSPNPSTKGSK